MPSLHILPKDGSLRTLVNNHRNHHWFYAFHLDFWSSSVFASSYFADHLPIPIEEMHLKLGSKPTAEV
jgi:hypothetical protein